MENTVRIDGSVTVGGTKTQKDRIAGVLNELLRTRASKNIILIAEPQVPFSLVTEIVDIANGVGVETIFLADLASREGILSLGK